MRMSGNLYVIPDARFRPLAASVWFTLDDGRGLLFLRIGVNSALCVSTMRTSGGNWWTRLVPKRFRVNSPVWRNFSLTERLKFTFRLEGYNLT